MVEYDGANGSRPGGTRGEGYDDVQKTENTRLNSNLSNGEMAKWSSRYGVDALLRMISSFVSPFVHIGSCLVQGAKLPRFEELREHGNPLIPR